MSRADRAQLTWRRQLYAHAVLRGRLHHVTVPVTTTERRLFPEPSEAAGVLWAVSRVAGGGAVTSLGGWLVAVGQASLTWNRLMVASDERSSTALEAVLLWAGVVLAAVWAATLPRRHRTPDLREARRVATVRLGLACLLLLTWYGVAVTQWWLVLAAAVSDPADVARFQRDPTLLEPALLGGALLCGTVCVARLLRDRVRR